MSDINIHKDSRNRGLEVLLYHQEKEPVPSENDEGKCKLKLGIPLLFGRKFHFQLEFYITNHLKLSESK
jgi:hypothetical protein